MIRRGLNDSDNNRLLTTSQLKERVKQWRKWIGLNCNVVAAMDINR
jgi:hypothetical protein